MRSALRVACLGFLACLGTPAGFSQNKISTLQVVKYEGLKQAVLQKRGKVVIVDFWGEF